MGVFNSKNFNSEVFGKYMETVPRVKQNAFIQSGVLKGRQDLKTMLVDQTGGNFISVPMTGRIGGDSVNYDGSTDISSTTLDTFLQSMIVVGRAKAWEEKDFSKDITGHDFMQEIASQVADYWDDVDQQTILAELEGIFKCSDDNFADNHTLDISAESSSAAYVGATTLNNAIQKSAGANKNLFKMVIMHSQVATNLENLNLVDYRKYTDAQGIQRDIGIADWNGRTVMIDDDVPTVETVGTQGVYTLSVSTAATAGDKITFFGTEYEFVANDASDAGNKIKVGAAGTAAQQAANIATKLSALTSGTATKYTITSSTTTVVFTQKTTSYGYHKPTVTATKGESGTIVVSMAETTASVEYIKYTSYILGEGAFDYCDCGANVPYETDRNPSSAGGKEYLYSRQRKVFAPKGFSFKMPSPSIISPTEAQLKADTAWGVVKNTAGDEYYNGKAIPFARIISKG